MRVVLAGAAAVVTNNNLSLVVGLCMEACCVSAEGCAAKLTGLECHAAKLMQSVGTMQLCSTHINML